MKAIYCFLIIAILLAVDAGAQSGEAPRERARVVVTDQLPKVATTTTPVQKQTPAADQFREVKTGQTLSFREIKSRIAEARRELQTKPLSTASTASTSSTGSADSTTTATVEFVRIAFHDWKSGRIDFIVMSKEAFLSTVGEKELISESGKRVRSRTIRGNGVNTPIVISDENGQSYLPLMVQYPVIRNGKFIEMAYYMSTHPGLVTPEVVNAGRFYVRNVVELARERLREKGIVIQPKIADIAERLSAVEHVDHMRFRNEPHSVIFDDIYTLYALNEGQTYRYSVSTAGAGGMVQMIPSTYRMVRSWHPNVPLMLDFVEGMQNHVNATQAMLLYMQRTWNDLVASQTVSDAFANGVATQEQLMAAGYNSNPARIAGYINRAGSDWKNLIPQETKVYLSIFASIEQNVPMAARSK